MADASPTRSHGTADLIYDAFYSGAIGGSVVALFFLVIDTWNGEPLFTPSLLGSVLFSGVAAAEVTGVHLGMVAWYSLVHFAAFGALGVGVALLVHEVELHARHPLRMLLALMLGLCVGFPLVAAVLMPGVVEVLGVGAVFAANVLAAGAIALFVLTTHRPELWQRFKHAAHMT